MTLVTLGFASLSAGAGDDAVARLQQALRIFHRRADLFGVARCLEGLAAALAATDTERAALLAGAAGRLFEEHALVMCAPKQALHAHVLAQLERRLGRRAAAEHQAQGRSLPLRHAVAESLAR